MRHVRAAGLDDDGDAADDLVGWRERKDGETKVYEGLFSRFGTTREEAEEMVMAARKLAGWVEDEADAEDAEGDEA